METKKEQSKLTNSQKWWITIFILFFFLILGIGVNKTLNSSKKSTTTTQQNWNGYNDSVYKDIDKFITRIYAVCDKDKDLFATTMWSYQQDIIKYEAKDRKKIEASRKKGKYFIGYFDDWVSKGEC